MTEIQKALDGLKKLKADWTYKTPSGRELARCQNKDALWDYLLDHADTLIDTLEKQLTGSRTVICEACDNTGYWGKPGADNKCPYCYGRYSETKEVQAPWTT